MKSLLHTLQQAYQYPVDIEFTINGTDTGEFVFNLLQCRPLQVGTRRDAVTVPSLPEDKTVFSVTGSSMGGSRAEDIDYVVFVDSRAYYEFPYKRKPDIAHIIGDINHHFRKSNQNLLLFVPWTYRNFLTGTWGSCKLCRDQSLLCNLRNVGQ